MPGRIARAAARGASGAASADVAAITAVAGVAAVADRVHSAAIHLLRWLRREDDGSGLSAPRLSALSVVVFAGPITLGELATAEQVRPPTITRLIAALEEEGLVLREVDASDRRVVRVRATARGRNLLMAGRARRVTALATAIGELGTDDRELLARAAVLLERLAARETT
jgi:DNA-binding MarR family transcriptional regulator